MNRVFLQVVIWLWGVCVIPAIIEPLRPHEMLPTPTVDIPVEVPTESPTEAPTEIPSIPVWPTETSLPEITVWPSITPSMDPIVPTNIPQETLAPVYPDPTETVSAGTESKKEEDKENIVAEKDPVKTEWAYLLTNPSTKFVTGITDGKTPSVLLNGSTEISVDSVLLNGKPVDYVVSNGRVVIDPSKVQSGKNRVTMEVHDSFGNFTTMKPWEFYEEELFQSDNCAIINSNDENQKMGVEIVEGPSKKKTLLVVIGTICAVLLLAAGGIALGMHVVSSNQEKAAAQAQKEAEAKEQEQQAALAAEDAKRQEEEAAAAKAEEEEKAAAEQAAIDQAQAEALEGKRENAETMKVVGNATTGNVNEYAIATGEAQSGEATQKLTGSANGHKVAIDAGHQAHGNSEQEPIGPGAGETKAKVASGTHGDASGLDEYELNLQVALQLRDELVARGYEVYMIRETNDVNISNAERAQAAANSGAEILVRVHANGSDDHSFSGALTMAPGSDNSYMSSDLIQNSQRLSQVMIDSFCAATGARNLGAQNYNNMSGINWSTIPVTIVEMGFMTNADEDLRMASADYQQQMVQGMSNGVDAYFAG